MAVIRQANLLGQQRLDVPHVRAIESAVAGDFDVLAGQMLSGEQAVILNGFRLSTSTAGGAATDLKLQVAGGMMMHFNASESGTVFSVPADRADEELTSVNTKVIGSFTANQTNYIGIDFRRAADSTTADLVQFIDPTTGKETSATVPLARTLDYRIYISTTNFDQTLNICPVAKVVTDPSNNVSSITDARQMMFRLATGGTSPSASYVYPWAQGRNETTAVDGWSGGDKAIGSLKEWQDAVMTRLWELGGGEYWYANAADRNVTMIGNGSTFSNGEYFVWTLGTNTLQWQNLRFLFDNSTANYNSVVNGTAVLADGDCVYVDLNRSTTNPAVDTVTPVKGTLATLGTSAIPGNRYVIAWRNGNSVYTRGWRYAVGTTFTPATTTSTGVVQLNNTPGSATNPSVVSIMSNGQAEVTATANNSHGIKGTGHGNGPGVLAVAGSNKRAFLADGGTSVIKSNENQTTLGRNAVSALQLVQEYTSAYNRRYEIQFYSGAVATGNVISGIASEYTSFDATNGTGGDLLFWTKKSTDANPSERVRVDSNGGIGITGLLSNSSTRPSIAAATNGNEIRAISASSATSDDGFLRISAGGGTTSTAKSYIDLSGFSNVADMNQNIILGTSGVERMRIGSNGSVTINTPSGGALALDAQGWVRIGGTAANNYSPLTVVGSVAIQQANPLLNFMSADGNTRFGYLYHNGASSGDIQLLNQVAGGGIRLGTNNVDRVILSSAGNVTIKGSEVVQEQNTPSYKFFAYSTTAGNVGTLQFYRSRSNSIGTISTVSDGDLLGAIGFNGANNDSANYTLGANIRADVDGTPGASGTMPARLVFATRNNLGTFAERMRISNGGNVTINAPTSGNALTVNGPNNLGGYEEYIAINPTKSMSINVYAPDMMAAVGGVGTAASLQDTTNGFVWVGNAGGIAYLRAHVKLPIGSTITYITMSCANTTGSAQNFPFRVQKLTALATAGTASGYSATDVVALTNVSVPNNATAFQWVVCADLTASPVAFGYDNIMILTVGIPANTSCRVEAVRFAGKQGYIGREI